VRDVPVRATAFVPGTWIALSSTGTDGIKLVFVFFSLLAPRACRKTGTVRDRSIVAASTTRPTACNGDRTPGDIAVPRSILATNTTLSHLA
jgi:hypothetical protein